MKQSLTKLIGALAVSTALVLAGNALAQEKKKVTYAIGTADLNVGYPFATLAKGLGYFDEEGLDVNIVPGQSSASVAQLLLGGRADIGVVQPDPLMIQRANNDVPLIPFYAVSRHGTNRLIVPINSPIQAVKDIKGKTIGVNDLGSGSVIWLRARVKEQGWTMNDIKLIATGYGTPGFEALKNGQVDASISFTGGIARQIIAGYPVRTLPQSEADKVSYSYNLYTLQKYIDENPDVIAKIGRATAKATVFLMTNPTASVHTFWKQYPDRAPKDLNDQKAFENDLAIIKAQIQDMAADEFPPEFKWGSQDLDIYKKMQGVLVDADQIKTQIDPAKFFTAKFEADYVKFDVQKIVAAAKAAK